MFWLKDYTIKDLIKNITNMPDTWLSARMRQNCAREALSACNGAVELGKKLEKQAIKPSMNVFSSS